MLDRSLIFSSSVSERSVLIWHRFVRLFKQWFVKSSFHSFMNWELTVSLNSNWEYIPYLFAGLIPDVDILKYVS